jgi:hypothetical protein
MQHGEYERRRRVLEAQFREDVELLRAGYQAKLRALEMIGLPSSGEALPAVLRLITDELIAMAHHSDGHSPTRYRKLPPPLEAGDGRR